MVYKIETRGVTAEGKEYRNVAYSKKEAYGSLIKSVHEKASKISKTKKKGTSKKLSKRGEFGVQPKKRMTYKKSPKKPQTQIRLAPKEEIKKEFNQEAKWLQSETSYF